MSQDVEIVEAEKQIIDISDEEDCKVVLIVDDDDEVEEIEDDGEVSQDEVLDAERRQQSIVASLNNYISTGGNTVEPTVGNGIKQENNINDYAQDEANIAPPMSTCVSQAIKTENQAGNRRRKRKKGNRRKNLSGAVSKEIESNNISPNIVQVTRNSSNRNISATYNFSKLKWLRPLNNLTSPPHLQMVIIDRGHPEWRIESDKWLMVEKRLLEALNTEMIRSNDPSIGLFDGAKWQRGIKIIGCHNENAFDFIMKFFVNLDKLWNGANLDAFPITNISRHIVRAYIPPPTIKTEVIMSLIKLQNPSVYSDDWKFVRERERAGNGGMDIWISVNDQSFMQLSRVRGEVKFGINRIFINPTS